MRNIMILFITLIILNILFISCASSSIESVMDKSYTAKISKLFVIVDTGKPISKLFLTGLEEELRNKMDIQGIEIFIFKSDELTLKNKFQVNEDIKNKVKEFNPDLVMKFSEFEQDLYGINMGDHSTGGNIVELIVPNSEKVIWKARLSLLHGIASMDMGVKAAKLVVGKLLDDGLI